MACLAGSIFMMVMVLGASRGLLGLVLSTVTLIFGIGSLLSKDNEGKRPGLILTIAGVLGMFMRFVKLPPVQAVAGTLLTIGALGLLAAGIWKGVQFLFGLQTRR